MLLPVYPYPTYCRELWSINSHTFIPSLDSCKNTGAFGTWKPFMSGDPDSATISNLPRGPYPYHLSCSQQWPLHNRQIRAQLCHQKATVRKMFHLVHPIEEWLFIMNKPPCLLSLHACLANIAKLKADISRNPMPPLSLSLHNFFQLIQWIFFSSLVWPH